MLQPRVRQRAAPRRLPASRRRAARLGLRVPGRRGGQGGGGAGPAAGGGERRVEGASQQPLRGPVGNQRDGRGGRDAGGVVRGRPRRVPAGAVLAAQGQRGQGAGADRGRDTQGPRLRAAVQAGPRRAGRLPVRDLGHGPGGRGLGGRRRRNRRRRRGRERRWVGGRERRGERIRRGDLRAGLPRAVGGATDPAGRRAAGGSCPSLRRSRGGRALAAASDPALADWGRLGPAGPACRAVLCASTAGRGPGDARVTVPRCGSARGGGLPSHNDGAVC